MTTTETATTCHSKNNSQPSYTWEVDKIQDLVIERKKQKLDFLLRLIIASFNNVTYDHIISKSRKKEYVLVRHLFCYFAVVRAGFATTETGYFLNRDHSTVIHGRDSINDYLFYDKQVKRIVEEIESDAKRLQLW